MSITNLCDHIYFGKEDRRREYKAPMPWTDELSKAKITKAILAMSNIKDGGVIIVGMRELEDKTFSPDGLSDADAQRCDSRLRRESRSDITVDELRQGIILCLRNEASESALAED